MGCAAAAVAEKEILTQRREGREGLLGFSWQERVASSGKRVNLKSINRR